MPRSSSLSTVTAAPFIDGLRETVESIQSTPDHDNGPSSRWSRWAWASAAIDLTAPFAVAREKQSSGTRAS